jgi:hypothetical protein
MPGRLLFRFGCTLLSMVVIFASGVLSIAHAAENAPITGEILKLVLDTADIQDNWTRGYVVVGDQTIIIPRNLIADLPANRLTLRQIFDQAPFVCQTSGAGGSQESGLAKGDSCVAGGHGAIATILANRTEAGDTIAGEIHIEKALETVTGTVTYINYSQGYFRVNGDPAEPATTGAMVRINDPGVAGVTLGRHTIQRGLGCPAAMAGRVAANCSPDIRFAVGSDSYTWTFSTGYPVCIPSVLNGADPASGIGDINCPDDNRHLGGTKPPVAGFKVGDATHFAPMRVGDHVTATGSYETPIDPATGRPFIDPRTRRPVRLLSAHNGLVGAALMTRDLADQPDYIRVEEVVWDAPGFQTQRARFRITGVSTLADSPIDLYGVHWDPNNVSHDIPLGTTVGNPHFIKGAGVLPPILGHWTIVHDVDFRVFKSDLSPCANLGNGGSGMCSGLGLIAEDFTVLSPIARDIVVKTRNGNGGRRNPAIVPARDINGNVTPSGRYVNPTGIEHPDFAEVNPNFVNTPYSFDGIPWNLDRRVGPDGCESAPAGCGAGPFALDPFPSSYTDGRPMNPRNQRVPSTRAVPTASVPESVRYRILSFFDPDYDDPGLQAVTGTQGGFNPKNLLPWPPADPPKQTVPDLPFVDPVCTQK